MSESEDVRARCHNVLPGHGKTLSIAATLREIADSLGGDEYGDVYGTGPFLADFEAQLATQFGKESAVFMPSGTMAQQIALRLWCEQSGRSGVAMHPTAHLETAEYLAYQLLHGLHRIQFGAPEVLHSRMLSLADLQALPEKPGAVLLEVPCRPLGGEIPDWDELTELSSWARSEDIPVHLDGARIWQCRDAYGRSYADIGALFDSIYVSFYKDLGGLAGCLLLGPEKFVAESRVWQRRHGGNLYSQAPYIAAAKRGLESCLPQLPEWNRRAAEVAAIVNGIDGFTTRPILPRVNFFQVHIDAPAEALEKAHRELATDTGTFVFQGFKPGLLPGSSMAEVHCWENAMAFDTQQLTPFLTQLMKLVMAPGGE